MMKGLWDVWPWNMDSPSGFLALFAAVFVLGALFARFGAPKLVDLVAGGAASGIPVEMQGPPGAPPYRDPAAPARKRLAIGFVPSGPDLWAVAHLRGGSRGLSEALLAAASAAGWIRPSGGAWGVGGYEPGEPLLRRLYEKVTRLGATVTTANLRRALGEVAAEATPTIEADLQRAGLARSGGARALAVGLVALVGASVAMLALVRMSRADALGRPHGLLDLELLAAVGVSFWIAVVVARQKANAAGARYLAWVDGITTSLRADVGGGRRYAPEDVALVTAVAGLGVLMTAPMFAHLAPMHVVTTPIASAGGSSCSSSSCGGGGGCGGCGGCGGGGGCGG